jgi:NADPH-dependent glutamate synthase beta subunit-like oxidoreductase
MSAQRESNPILDFARGYQFPEYTEEVGLERIVAFGDKSHKCPVYVTRTPPCSASCPANEDIRGYNNILRGIEKFDNRWEAAWRRIVDKNPFPSVMGRVCPAPCQGGCNRQQVEETISINAIEHAIGEYGIKNNLKLERLTQERSGKRIAVVGGGPAGLSAAYQLLRRGHDVTLYEALPKLGGTVRYGIMGYRVSREVFDAEIQRIVDLGLQVKTNTRIGKEISLADLRKEYDAVFIGVGAMKGRDLPIAGWQAGDENTNAINVLVNYELDSSKVRMGRNVLVIGDGDVSMDAARLALRYGSKAAILSAVAREDMKCTKFEFDEASAEGTAFHYAVSAVEVVRENGRMTGLKCVRMQKKEKGEDGWNAPIPFLRYKPVPGTEFVIPGDMVIASIGQTTDMTGLEETTGGKSPFLQLDANFQVKGMPGVFGGGDAYRIELITTAVGHGRRAAEAIDAYVRGLPIPSKPYEDVIKFKKLKSDYFERRPAIHRTHHHPERVEGNFNEIITALGDDLVKQEAERCMSCGLCFECRQCMMYCPQEAITMFRKNPIGEVMYTDYNRCVGCHICAEICPTGYIDMGMGEDL